MIISGTLRERNGQSLRYKQLLISVDTFSKKTALIGPWAARIITLHCSSVSLSGRVEYMEPLPSSTEKTGLFSKASKDFWIQFSSAFSTCLECLIFILCLVSFSYSNWHCTTCVCLIFVAFKTSLSVVIDFTFSSQEVTVYIGLRNLSGVGFACFLFTFWSLCQKWRIWYSSSLVFFFKSNQTEK